MTQFYHVLSNIENPKTHTNTKQAQESLAAAMSLSDISGIVTSWADGYKNSTPNFNFGI